MPHDIMYGIEQVLLNTISAVQSVEDEAICLVHLVPAYYM